MKKYKKSDIEFEILYLKDKFKRTLSYSIIAFIIYSAIGVFIFHNVLTSATVAVSEFVLVLIFFGGILTIVFLGCYRQFRKALEARKKLKILINKMKSQK